MCGKRGDKTARSGAGMMTPIVFIARKTKAHPRTFVARSLCPSEVQRWPARSSVLEAGGDGRRRMSVIEEVSLAHSFLFPS